MSVNLSLTDLIIIAATLIAAFVLVKWVGYIIKKTGTRLEIDLTVIQVLDQIIKYTVYTIAIVIVLNVLGINVTAIALSLGIVGVAVGFASRDTIANFISGIFVLADKSFKVGDIIEVSDKRGRVVKMGFRLTTIMTTDQKTIIVPNSTFSKNPYTNYTASAKRRVDLDINLPYAMELEDLVKNFEEVALKFKWTLEKPKPQVLIKELSDTGVKAVLTTWVDDPWKVEEYRSSLAKEVEKVMVQENA